jgi:hypothetical protein
MRINPTYVEAHPAWSDSVLELREVVDGEIRVALIRVRSPYVLDQLQRRLARIREHWQLSLSALDQ